MIKQAVALLVHQNAEQVNALVHELSAEFDIYIHIDKKSDLTVDQIRNQHTYKEVKVKWGGFGMVSATVMLYKKILASGIDYSHVILLSGDSRPVKPVKDIRGFLAAHQGVSFIENEAADEISLERRRLIFYNPDMRKKPRGLGLLFHPLHVVRAIQRRTKIFRGTRGFERKGSQWTILAMDHLRHLVDNCRLFPYKTMAVPDESFVQNHFHNYNIPYSENLIFANWPSPRGYSPDFIDEDKHRELQQSKYLFARKYRYNGGSGGQ